MTSFTINGIGGLISRRDNFRGFLFIIYLVNLFFNDLSVSTPARELQSNR
jgi:hypothetical protein